MLHDSLSQPGLERLERAIYRQDAAEAILASAEREAKHTRGRALSLCPGVAVWWCASATHDPHYLYHLTGQRYQAVDREGAIEEIGGRL